MHVLLAYLSVHRVHAVPTEARGECLIPLGLELQMVVSYNVAAGS